MAPSIAFVFGACLALLAAELAAPCAAQGGEEACAVASHDDGALLQLHTRGGEEQGDGAKGGLGWNVPASGSRYSKVEWIGFGINTFTDDRDENTHFYPGNSSDAVTDVNARLKILAKALNSAYEAAGKDPSTMKIFVVPEFYFRGAHGAYDATSIFSCPHKHLNAVAVLSEGLSQMVAANKFSDWLFVMGTVVAAHRTPHGDLTASPNDDWHYYNWAPIYKGGPHGKKFIVAKEYISDIDFLDKCLRPGGNKEECVPNPSDPLYTRLYSDVPPVAKWRLYFSGYKLVQDNAFEVDGIRFGLEICLDHAINAKGKGIPGGVQVHLITSAGMTITYSAAIQTVPVFLQDGRPHAQALMFCDPSRGPCTWYKMKADPLGPEWETMIEDYYVAEKPIMTIMNPFPVPAFQFTGSMPGPSSSPGRVPDTWPQVLTVFGEDDSAVWQFWNWSSTNFTAVS